MSEAIKPDAVITGEPVHHETHEVWVQGCDPYLRGLTTIARSSMHIHSDGSVTLDDIRPAIHTDGTISQLVIRDVETAYILGIFGMVPMPVREGELFTIEEVAAMG